MKYLKIENNKGYFSFDEQEWKQIDTINKDDLLILLNNALTTEFYMDEYSEENLANPAHQIIYRNIHEKLSEVLLNKTRFIDESEATYKNALDKYSG